MTTIRAKFDGRVLVPESPVNLPVDRLLEVDVRELEGDLPIGSPALILKLMAQAPHVSREDTDALERAIEEGKLPVRDEGIFDDLQDRE